MRISTTVFACALVLCMRSAAAADVSFSLSAELPALSNYYPTYLANGYWSLASAPLGTESAVSQMAGLMDQSANDVSRPAALPTWNEIDYFDGESWLNSAPVTAASHRHYRQTLNMRDATLRTSYAWHAGKQASDIMVYALVSQANPHLAAIQLEVTPRFSGAIRLRFTMRPLPAPSRLPLAEMTAEQFAAAAAAANQSNAAQGGKRDAIWYPGQVEVTSSSADAASRLLLLAGHAVGGRSIELAAAIALPKALRSVHVQYIEADGTPTIEVSGEVQRGHRYQFTKFVAATAEGWRGAHSARTLASGARAAGFDSLLAAHVAAWHDLWKADIEITGDVALQQTIHSDLFYLLENTTSGPGWPAAACGFSSHYFGHVFWDNDFWVFPALLLLHPDRARHLIEFRARFLPQAMARARSHEFAGAMYPWEADPSTGLEVTPKFAVENADREIHVNGAVALAQWQYYLASGDRGWLERRGYPVIAAVADFWAKRAAWRAGPQRYEIDDVTSPEEDYVHVDNEIYTNVVARQSLWAAIEAARTLGVPVHSAWHQVAAGLYVPTKPRDRRYYDFDPSTPHDKTNSWMATSVPMLSIPAVGFEADRSTLEGLFEHSSQAVAHVRERANQMILVMMAIQAADLGNADYFHDVIGGQGTSDPFLKPPFNVRSETPQNDSTYLLASSGGFLQAFQYGLTGLRFQTGGLVEKFPAILPPGVDSMTIRNLKSRGKTGTVTVVRDAAGKVIRTLKWEARS